MALSPPEGPSQPPSEQPDLHDLPATYRNPWTTLGENLEAVAADSRLRLQELVRRNGQGSLWRPRWWPVDLAPLFWPLVLALALALLLWLGVQGAAAIRRFNAPSNAPSSPASLELEAPPILPAPELGASEPAAPQPAGSEPELAADETPASPQEQLLTPSEETVEETSQALEAEPAAAPEPLDALAELVQRPGADGLLITALPSADQRTLVLQVAAGFAALPAADQQRYAERWQLWAADLGYDHVELRDSRAGLLARDALVGSGMIVLDELSSP
jgi:hypothetical protein